MAKRSFQNQHRPERETKSLSNKEVAELKSENQKLRRKLARADKEIARLNGMVDSYVPEDEIQEVTTEPVISSNNCPKCPEVELKIVNLGARDFEICPSCKYRKLISA